MYNIVPLSNIIYCDQTLIVGTISVHTTLNVVLDIGTMVKCIGGVYNTR